MQDKYIECPELAGKTIHGFRLHRDTGEGTVIDIKFADGTSFSCTIKVHPEVRASLYRGGVGTPEILQQYEL